MSALAKLDRLTAAQSLSNSILGAGLSVDELVRLATLCADQANAKRTPNQGNRAFTFVTTYYDCQFPHKVFLQDVLPTNADAKKMVLEVPVLSPGGGHQEILELVSVVHNTFGHPMAWVRRKGDRYAWSCHYNSGKQMWEQDPD